MSKSEWPSLPEPGSTLLSDIEVDKPLEEIFIMMHGGLTEFRVSFSFRIFYSAWNPCSFFFFKNPHHVSILTQTTLANNSAEKNNRSMQQSKIYQHWMARFRRRRPCCSANPYNPRLHGQTQAWIFIQSNFPRSCNGCSNRNHWTWQGNRVWT